MKIVLGVVYILLGFAGYVHFFRRTKDPLNPFSITILTWLSIAGAACFQLSYLQTEWSFAMHLVVLLFPASVYLVGRATSQVQLSSLENAKIDYSNVYLLFSRFVFIVCFLCSMIEWSAQGFAIPLFMRQGSDAKHMVSAIPGIHYGTVFLSYCALASIFELLYRRNFSKLSKPFLYFSIAWAAFYAIAVTISRGTLLLVAMGMLLLVLRGLRISFKAVLCAVAAVFVAFVVIGRLRIHPMSLVYNVVEGHPLISAIYSYSALSFENLNRLVTKGPAWTICTQTFWGGVQMFGLAGFFREIPSEVTKFFNATTLCYDFYEDLGHAGIVIFTALIYGAVGIIYRKSQTNVSYLLPLAALQKPIWMCFFGNYFTASRVDIILFIGILVYVLVLDQGEQLVSKGRMGKAYDRMVLRTWLGTLSKML